MAKRFTDTEKWKKPFIKSMQTVYKLFWLYILDNCDHAGIWHVEKEVAEIRMNEKIDLKKAKEQFGERVIVFDNGNKWFIPDFIKFQYGVLNEVVKTHKSVIDILKKYKLLTYCLQTVKDKDKEMDMDKDKEIVEENKKILCENSEIWLEDICMKKSYKLPEVKKHLKEFIADQELKGEMDREINDIRKHFVNYLKVNIINKKSINDPEYLWVEQKPRTQNEMLLLEKEAKESGLKGVRIIGVEN